MHSPCCGPSPPAAECRCDQFQSMMLAPDSLDMICTCGLLVVAYFAAPDCGTIGRRCCHYTVLVC